MSDAGLATFIGAVVLMAGLCGACSDPGPGARVAGQSWPVIYGDDDRVELHEVADDALRDVLERSVAAIVDEGTLSFADGAATLATPTFGELANLCEGERFADQPTAALCSAILIDEQTVLTAGHCMRRIPCDTALFVFGYANEPGAATPHVHEADVYRCSEVLVRELSLPESPLRIDFAWVRLDRPARERAALVEVRPQDDPVRVGETLSVAGFGGGIPMKVSSGRVTDARLSTLDHFVTSVDALHGDSGAPLFDAELRLAGIQVRGNPDFAPAPDGCNASTHLDATPELAGEQSTYAFRALEGLCDALPDAEACCLQDDSCAARRREPTGGCAVVTGVPAGGRGLCVGACSVSGLLVVWRCRRRRRRLR